MIEGLCLSLNGWEAPVRMSEFTRAFPRLPSTAEKRNITAVLTTDEWTDLKLIFRRSEPGKGILLIKQVVSIGQVNNPSIRLFRSSQLLLLKRHRFSPFRSLLNTPVFTITKFFKNFEFANNRLALFIFPFASPDF